MLKTVGNFLVSELLWALTGARAQLFFAACCMFIALRFWCHIGWRKATLLAILINGVSLLLLAFAVLIAIAGGFASPSYYAEGDTFTIFSPGWASFYLGLLYTLGQLGLVWAGTHHATPHRNAFYVIIILCNALAAAIIGQL